MARIVYRGAYATFPVLALTDAGDLAYATDLLILYEWSGVAWFPYHDYPDYEGGKSRLLTVADWAAIEATDINFYAFLNNAARLASAALNWVVPPGRTLYITNLAFCSEADLAADADNNQMCRGRIYEGLAPTEYLQVGGNGGGSIVFTKPAVFTAGQRLDIACINTANHNCDLHISAAGYLI